MAELERAVAQQVSRLDHPLMTKRDTEIDDLRAAWPVPGPIQAALDALAIAR